MNTPANQPDDKRLHNKNTELHNNSGENDEKVTSNQSIDEEIDEIFTTYNERKRLSIKNTGAPYKARQKAKQSIKQLITEEVIKELENTMPYTDGMRHYNTVVGRISELKGEV